MRNKRHRSVKSQHDLLSFVETPRQKAERMACAGNYATRTVRRWIRTDPHTLAGFIEAVHNFSRSRMLPYPYCATIDSLLAEWFEQTVRAEEPSTAYAEFLEESIDVDWPMLAAEVTTGAWTDAT